MLKYRQVAAAEPAAGLTPIKILASKYIFPNPWMGIGNQPVCDLRKPEFDAQACKALYPAAHAISYFGHTWERRKML